MPEASLILAGDASSVPAARRFVAQTLESWGQVEASWAAAQIVSELAGNCALHARTEFCVRLVKQDRTVRLEVQDGSAARVQPRHYGRESTTGRGLRLVERLGTDWGVDLHAGGKTVWVALRLSTDDGGRELADGADAVDAESLLAAFDEDAAWERTTASYDVAVFRTAA